MTLNRDLKQVPRRLVNREGEVVHERRLGTPTTQETIHGHTPDLGRTSSVRVDGSPGTDMYPTRSVGGLPTQEGVLSRPLSEAEWSAALRLWTLGRSESCLSLSPGPPLRLRRAPPPGPDPRARDVVHNGHSSMCPRGG